MNAYEGRRWAVIHVVGFGQNRHAMYYRNIGKGEKPRLVDDRYRATTWATRETAERHARSLGPRYEAVEVYL